MSAELHSAGTNRIATAYQMLLFVDSDTCTMDSLEMSALRLLHDEALIRLVESGVKAARPNPASGDDYEVDASLYSLVYGILHPEHDGGIATASGTEKAMHVAKAVRHGADIFVTSDERITNRNRPFERQTDMHLLSPTEALELVMQEINNAD
ncbi:MAG: hypothetical protein Q7K25_00910 [Actinomycetota bacterium]|nr:hypothetical protein [Actinomycetota bacterium]